MSKVGKSLNPPPMFIVGTLAIFIITSLLSSSMVRPNAAYSPSNQVAVPAQIKNCEVALLGSEVLAIEITPNSCFNSFLKPLLANSNNYNHYEQDSNSNHTKEDIIHDLSGKYVLICEEFYYYGVDNAIDIEKDVFNVTVPRCKKLVLDDYDRFIRFIKNDRRVIIKGKI